MWLRRLGSSFLGSALRYVALLIFIAVICSSASADNALGVPDSEYNALVALYNSTDGPNWTNNTNWLTSNPGWYGVYISDGHVTQLNLYSNQLSGIIPLELGNLTNLRDLSLNYNQLTGTIPQELGNLTNLLELYINGNQLTGTIPTVLGNMTNLRKLNISSNLLTGTIPPELGNLTNLQDLYLYNNQLTGTISPELCNLTSLQSLNLSDNQLGGAIPPELGNLANLQDLSLNNNQLTGMIPLELGNLTILKYLDLYNNQLTGTIPSELGNMTNLWRLYLYNNQLTGTIPPELGNLTNLWYLSFYNNQLSGEIPPELGNLINLWELGLSYNQLSGMIPPELGNLANLRILSLRFNQLTGTIPPELGNMTNLCDLYLSSNQLTGTIPSSLTNLSSLMYGDISYNGLFTSDPTLVSFLDSHFGEWDQTQTIAPAAVSASTISPGGAQVSWPPILYTADAGYYEVGYSQTPGGPYTHCGQTVNKLASSIAISGLPDGMLYLAVRTVTLPNTYNQNTVTSLWSAEAVVYPNTLNIPDSEFNALVALYNSTDGPNWRYNTNWLTSNPGWYGVTVSDGHVTELNLYYNQLAGTIPSELGNLTNINTLWLSTNQLTGTIPPELGNLPNLCYLDLGYNQLSGTIPQELGNLINLRELLLSNNQLSGAIPLELGNLTKLLHLSFAKNQLIGTIPTELGNLINLQILILSNNQLSGAIPTELGNLTNLRELSLHYNQLSGMIPPELGNPTTLQFLYLSSNQLSGIIPPELGNLTNLRWLGLSGNQLSGTVPPEFGNLMNLLELCFDYNHLSGTIPLELCNLTNLQRLYLNSNQLSGAIPPELGNLINLRELYLSNNQLTGTIPSSLTNLTHLVFGGVSYNSLSASNPTLISFLDSHFWEWKKQTIPPTAVSASTISPGGAQVSWTPIFYTADAGYYEVGYSQTSGGPYTPCGQTIDKLASSIAISGLPDGMLYLAVRTVTLPNSHNQNTVTSLWSRGVAETCNCKGGPDGSPWDIYNAVVTAVFDGFFYVESPDRSSGIKVDYNWLTVPSGCVNITGDLGTLSSGERYIEASSVSPAGTGSVTPMALNNKSLGGGDWHYDPVTGEGQCGVTGALGLNNIGLLVRTCGKFNYVDSHTFTIDDGSGVNVKCIVPDGVVLDQNWSYVGVTGISSCEKTVDGLHRLLLVRTQDDITIY